MKKIITTIAFAAMLPVMAQAFQPDGTAETRNFIIDQVLLQGNSSAFKATNLAQPTRRDVGGAVILDLEHERTVDENGAELKTE